MSDTSYGNDPRVASATSADLEEVLKLLTDAELPLDGVREHLDAFLTVREGERLVGTIGLETYGDVGLLRSLAVSPDRRSAGHGARLVDELLARARAEGLSAVYLLTTTADRYFPRHGFTVISRAEADTRLAQSAEFQGACPASAVCMRRSLSDADADADA